MEDQYDIIRQSATSEIKVKGSRFIGHVAQCETREAAEAFIAEISKKHYDATHHCTAYRVGIGDDAQWRYNDDGEPSGTAGKPIYDMIEGRGLTQVCCVVTRYFGGTKLGCGGLVRAYGQAAADALDQAGRQTRYVHDDIRIAYPYDSTGVVMHLVERFEGRVEASDYTEETVQTIRLRRSRSEAFVRELVEASAGRVRILAEAAPQ